jgi:hypothetical protein
MATKNFSTRSKRSTRKTARNIAVEPIADDAVISDLTPQFERLLKQTEGEPTRSRAFALAFAAANWVADYEAFLAH